MHDGEVVHTRERCLDMFEAAVRKNMEVLGFWRTIMKITNESQNLDTVIRKNLEYSGFGE